MLDLLRETDIFRGLKSDELEKIAKINRVVELHDGDKIFGSGDDATSLYIVNLGEVKLLCTVEYLNGPIDVTIDRMKKGDVFGWSAISHPQRYRLSAHAVGDTELLRFRGDRIRILCEESDHIGNVMMSNITTIISDRYDKLEGLLKHIIQSALEK